MPESWIVGLEMADGRYRTLSESDSVIPSDVEEVIFPISLPWEDDPLLFPVLLEQVEVVDRKSGPERHYSARVEDAVPNSDQIWEMELELWEYPRGAFNMSRLTHTDQVRNASWDDSDLLKAIGG